MMRRADAEPFEEPVDCLACGRTHELQESYFCFAGCAEAQGLCRQCARRHRDECPA